MALRDADELILPAVKATIAALEATTDADTGIIKLAERYAAALDAATTTREKAYALRYLGPLLHDALESLGATPAARSKTTGRTAAGGGQLAQLRAARRA